MIVAVAYFKKIAKAFTQDLLSKIKGDEEVYYPYLKVQLETFFEV